MVLWGKVLWNNVWQVGIVIAVTRKDRCFTVCHLISHEAPEYCDEVSYDQEWRWVQQATSSIVVKIVVSVGTAVD